MLSGKEELAGGSRLASIRRAKRYLYLIEIIILIVAIVFVFEAEGRVSLVPFYFPLNSIIYFVLLMVLIITVESFVFTALEMRVIKSTSTKYYICKIGIRRSLVAIVICLVVVLLLWLPFVPTSLEDASTTRGTLINDHSTSASSFCVLYDRDPLGLSSLKHIGVSALGGDARVYLVSEQIFNANKFNLGNIATFRINVNDYIADPNLDFEVDTLPFGKYYLVLDTSQSDSASSVNYSLRSTISSEFLSYVPIFAIAFAVAFAAWMLYLWPLKRKYSEAAIYR